MSIALLNLAVRRPQLSRPAAPAAAIAPSLPKANPVFPAPALAASTLTLDELEGAGALTGGSLPIPEEAERVLLGGAAQPTLRPGAQGQSVRVLQQRLAERGFNPGAADGVMGPQTVRALKQFQSSQGLVADGIAGERTWGKLGPAAAAAPATPGPALSVAATSGLAQRLITQLGNRFRGVRHQCFRYAWTMVAGAGGRGIDGAGTSRAQRNQPITSLKTMAANGTLKPGDVIYANRRPGADPSSRNLAYGPHWFVYLGNDRYADQYGVRNAEAMQAFVPGRKIDTIYHPFA